MGSISISSVSGLQSGGGYIKCVPNYLEIIKQCLHELSVLFSGGSAPSGVMPLHSLREQYGWDGGVMSFDGCSYCKTLIDCWATAPGYVTFILDLHYGMPLALFVSQILSFIMFYIQQLFIVV